ncbi:MAG: hypothetical protein KAX49_07140 [Halanaerobiales bacterium]|nr:hypothetical protein [Halanaerobiales bacterium]
MKKIFQSDSANTLQRLIDEFEESHIVSKVVINSFLEKEAIEVCRTLSEWMLEEKLTFVTIIDYDGDKKEESK